MAELWLLVIVCSLATYAWRALGVVLSGRIAVDSEIFKWVTCVAYAMLAGLISRIVLMPGGMMAETFLVDRLAACGLALVAYRLARRNLLVAVTVGAGAMMAFAAFR